MMKRPLRSLGRKGLCLMSCIFGLSSLAGYGEGDGSPGANWPSFRGARAAGVAEGYRLPARWNGEDGKRVKWKTPIPGLAHSSPVIWGNSLFVTSAISSRLDAGIRHGLYGAGDASSDRSFHLWKVYCLDKNTGSILWQSTAHQGRPRCKRHQKATYANATPAVDGRYLVVWFGCEGLYTYSLDGNLVWQKDLGTLNVGAYDAPSYEWGPASSPIIFRDLVIVQVDAQEESYVMALDVRSGAVLWKTTRDELPSWGTPGIFEDDGRLELVTNGSRYIRGYDPLSGVELWRLGGSSKITAPTPIFWKNLIIVASGRRPEKPIFVIRGGASGDISLPEGESSNQYVKWSRTGRGPYMPTPLAYRGYLYVLLNEGIVDSYVIDSGTSVYRSRLSHRGGGFSASPVAGDGKVYLPGEDGDVFVVAAGPEFRLLSTNPLGELLLATPALSEGVLFLRGQKHVFAIGD